MSLKGKSWDPSQISWRNTPLCILSSPVMVLLTLGGIWDHCLLVTQHLRPNENHECATGYGDNHQSGSCYLSLWFSQTQKLNPHGRCWPSPWQLRTTTQNGAVRRVLTAERDTKKWKWQKPVSTSTSNHLTLFWLKIIFPAVWLRWYFHCS